jgi:hypothetical protein
MLQYNTSLRCVCFEDCDESIRTTVAMSENNAADENDITVRRLLKSIQSPVLQRLYFVDKFGSPTLGVDPGWKVGWNDIDSARCELHARRPAMAQTVWIFQSQVKDFDRTVGMQKVLLPLCIAGNLIKFVRVEVYSRTMFENGDPCL